MNIRIIVGFAAALLIGGGAGAAVIPLAGGASVDRAPTTKSSSASPKVVVQQVRGEAVVLAASGEWRPVRATERLSRPVVIQASGWSDQVDLRVDDTRLILERNARVSIGAGNIPSLQLEKGFIRIYAPSTAINTHVPGRLLQVSGQTYGIWVRQKEVAVSAMEGQVEISTPEGKQKFGVLREIIIDTEGKLTQFAINAKELPLQISSVSRRGRRFVLNGKTSVSAMVAQRVDGLITPVDVSLAGTFSVRLETRKPDSGELLAFDSLGRISEVDRPSQSFDQAVAILKGDMKAPPSTPGTSNNSAARGEPAAVVPKKEPASSPETSVSGRKPRAAKQDRSPSSEAVDKPKRRTRKPTTKASRAQETPPPVPLNLKSNRAPPAVKVGAPPPPPPPPAGNSDEDEEEPL